jgi:hypothetical protein
LREKSGGVFVTDRSVSRQLFSFSPLLLRFSCLSGVEKWLAVFIGSIFSRRLLLSFVWDFSSFVMRLDDYPSSRTGKQDHYSLKNPFQRSKQLTWPPLICKLYPTAM